jgi:RimJ/RimL family protein N-acetyltransferase
MIYIQHTNIYKIHDYSTHLKSLPDEDKFSRFGYIIKDQSIDQLILDMCCHPEDHELWYARTDDTRVGWGHMAKNIDGSWELAVSVQKDYQRQGIGNKLIIEMLDWAKFHKIPEVYMHCIEDNKVIQHLASKNNLKQKFRGDGERTSAIEVPEPTIFETNAHIFREQAEIIADITQLRTRLADLWNPFAQKH